MRNMNSALVRKCQSFECKLLIPVPYGAGLEFPFNSVIASRMARIAILTVEHISGNTCVARIGLGLRVTRRAREDLVVHRIGVASGTNPSRIPVARGEPGVIERRSRPGGCGMTRLAGRRIP